MNFRHLIVCTVVLLLLASLAAAQPQRGQQRGEQVPPAQGWKMTTLLDGLENPWGIAFLPNGEMLITERRGRMRLVRDGQLVERPIEGVPQVFAQGQGGLMDLSLHPDFEENGLIYFTYSAGDARANRSTLARAKFDGSRLEDVEVIFGASHAKSSAQHFGSRILWLPDGTMLVSVGDGGNPPVRIDGTLAREHGQRLDSTLACIVRLKDDGSAPDDNPLVDREGARPEIYSYGHRNIQGMARDPESGRIWANEHGPLGGDELNLIEAGENYGWPLATHGRDYRTGQEIAPKTHPGTVDPKVVWIPAQAPSGLAFYTGDVFPEWQGDLFSGGLVTGEIRRVMLDGEQVRGEERLEIGDRVREVIQGPDGHLYVLTDERNGRLIRIDPEE